MNRYLYFFLINIFILTTVISAQEDLSRISDDNIVAKVGNQKISLEQFKVRYQLTPQYDRSGKFSEEIALQRFMYSLIAEKLWALEAEAMGLDTSEIMKNTFKSLEKMYVRDALFKKDIESNVRFNDSDVAVGLQRVRVKLAVNFLFSSDSTEIYSLYNTLLQGTDFDSLLNSRHEKEFQKEPLVIEFGKLEEETEDLLYSLTTKNESGKIANRFTHPVKESEGWLIYYLQKKEEKYLSADELKKLLGTVKTTIKTRRTDAVYQKFFRSFFAKKRIETDGILFWSLADKLSEILQDKKERGEVTQQGDMKLRPSDLSLIENKFGIDTLSMPFILFPEEPLTLKEFLAYFFFEGFFSNDASLNIIASKLNLRIKGMIEQELIAREGIKQGLITLPEVKQDIQMWRENYLAQIILKGIADSVTVSDQEIQEAYNNALNDTTNLLKVNILEVLTDSLEVIEKALNTIKDEISFREFASLHTKRTWTRERGGEFGLTPAANLGELGNIASKMNVGDTYGPIKLDEGYSIIRLIQKEDENISSLGFDEAKENLRKHIASEKLKTGIIDKTVQLAKKYGVSVDEKMLINSGIENLRMVVFRYMGFGGRITAVPLTPQFIEWVEPYQKEIKNIP